MKYFAPLLMVFGCSFVTEFDRSYSETVVDAQKTDTQLDAEPDAQVDKCSDWAMNIIYCMDIFLDECGDDGSLIDDLYDFCGERDGDVHDVDCESNGTVQDIVEIIRWIKPPSYINNCPLSQCVKLLSCYGFRVGSESDEMNIFLDQCSEQYTGQYHEQFLCMRNIHRCYDAHMCYMNIQNNECDQIADYFNRCLPANCDENSAIADSTDGNEIYYLGKGVCNLYTVHSNEKYSHNKTDEACQVNNPNDTIPNVIAALELETLCEDPNIYLRNRCRNICDNFSICNEHNLPFFNPEFCQLSCVFREPTQETEDCVNRTIRERDEYRRCEKMAECLDVELPPPHDPLP